MVCVRPRSFTSLSALLLALTIGTATAQQPAVPVTEKPVVSDQTVFPSPEPSNAPENPAATQTDQKVSQDPNPNLRLGPGDLLEVTVYNVPELTTRTRVSNTGDLYLPLIDYVHVAGLSAEESQKLIEKRLSDGGFVKDPHVALFVNESLSQTASLFGEVARPGVYPVYGQRRLFDLISSAGGFSERAGRVISVTHRSDPEKPETLHLARNISDKPEDNVEIQPGDTVMVQKADIVYVVGEVSRPSGFLMSQGTLTVLQAVALAGGTTGNAKLDGARILRKSPEGVAETPIELKKILRAKSPDVAMKSDDILFVPTSQSKVFGKRGLEAAIQAATALTIYTVR